MNSQEIMHLTDAVIAQYPSFKPTKTVLSEWQRVLADVSLADAKSSLDSYCREGNRFAPNAHLILKRIGITRKDDDGKRPEYMKSDSQYLRRVTDSNKEKGLVILAREHPAGFAWSYVAIEQARIYGRKVTRNFHGREQEIYLED